MVAGEFAGGLQRYIAPVACEPQSQPRQRIRRVAAYDSFERSAWNSERTTKQNSLKKTQTPFRPPLIVSGRVLGVLGAPLVPVDSLSYR